MRKIEREKKSPKLIKILETALIIKNKIRMDVLKPIGMTSGCRVAGGFIKDIGEISL